MNDGCFLYVMHLNDELHTQFSLNMLWDTVSSLLVSSPLGLF